MLCAFQGRGIYLLFEVKSVFFTLCVVVEKKVLTREMIHNWFIIVFLSSFTRLCLFLE